MAGDRNLQVGRWAAILVPHDRTSKEELFGSQVSEDEIPSGVRRRMGRIERLAVRCTLGVLQTRTRTDELIYCSRYGNVESLHALLSTVGSGELMSAITFSGSVHNAVPGLVGQIRKERLSHTAVAGGPQTFVAGLIESYTRLKLAECRDVTLTFADLPLPDGYHEFEAEHQPGIVLALRLECAATIAAAIAVKPGRIGVLGVLEGLKSGRGQIALEDSAWNESSS